MTSYRTYSIAVLSLCLASFAGCTQAQETMDADWSVATNLPYARSETAATVLNGKIYVMSGNAPVAQATNIAQEFDPATMAWRDLAAMPYVASHAGAAALDGKVYVVGGFVANVHMGAIARVHAYDPTTDSWETVAPLSAPRGSPGVVALNGRIHAIGGRDVERNTVATHEIYDPTTDIWTMAAPLPLARDHLGIAVVDGRIHVFGGRTGATVDNTGRHDIYDPATDSWSDAAPLQTPRSAGVAFYIDGHIVYAGGECMDPQARTTFPEAEAYNVASGEWVNLPMLPQGRHASAVAVVGDTAYIFGGNAGCGGDTPLTELLTLNLQ